MKQKYLLLGFVLLTCLAVAQPSLALRVQGDVKVNPDKIKFIGGLGDFIINGELTPANPSVTYSYRDLATLTLTAVFAKGYTTVNYNLTGMFNYSGSVNVPQGRYHASYNSDGVRRPGNRPRTPQGHGHRNGQARNGHGHGNGNGNGNAQPRHLGHEYAGYVLLADNFASYVVKSPDFNDFGVLRPGDNEIGAAISNLSVLLSLDFSPTTGIIFNYLVDGMYNYSGSQWIPLGLYEAWYDSAD